MDLIGIAQHRGLGIELVESLLFVLFLAELFPRGGVKIHAYVGVHFSLWNASLPCDWTSSISPCKPAANPPSLDPVRLFSWLPVALDVTWHSFCHGRWLPIPVAGRPILLAGVG